MQSGMMFAMKKAIVFACSNENHVKIFTPVAGALAEEGFLPLFFTFDGYYAQSASRGTALLPYPWFEVGEGRQNTNWWQLSALVQQEQVVEAEQRLFSLLRDKFISCCVLGNDYGPLEQCTIRQAELLGIRTVRIQDGTNVAPPPLDALARGHALLLGDGGCELNCVWASSIAEGFRTRGISGRLSVSGCPRYDALPQRRPPKEAQSVKTVLVATQCFEKFGLLTLGTELALYDHIIRIVLRRNDTRVILKLHPQTMTPEPYYVLSQTYNGLVSVDTETDSLSLLSQVDALLTITSTIAIEAALMGVPTRRLDSLLAKYSREQFQQYHEEFISQIDSPDFPESLSFEGESREAFIERHIGAQDGKAAKRICEEIKALISGEAEDSTDVSSSVTTIPPDTTVVILAQEAKTTIHAVRSVLRPGKVTREVLLLDPSTQGYLGENIRKAIGDERLRIIPVPNLPPVQALGLAFAEARSEVVLRLDSSCVALPGFVEHHLRALSSEHAGAVTLSCYGWRNQVGIVEQLHTLPNTITLKSLLADPLAANLVLAYGLRKSSWAPASLSPTSSLTEADIFIIASHLGGTESHKEISCLASFLFLSPIKPRN